MLHSEDKMFCNDTAFLLTQVKVSFFGPKLVSLLSINGAKKAPRGVSLLIHQGQLGRLIQSCDRTTGAWELSKWIFVSM